MVTIETPAGVTVADIVAGDLPSDATGVYWPATSWTECVECLNDAAWRLCADDGTDFSGIVCYAPVACDNVHLGGCVAGERV